MTALEIIRGGVCGTGIVLALVFGEATAAAIFTVALLFLGNDS